MWERAGGRMMNENIIKRNRLLAQKVIKGLQSRNMNGFYADNKEEALQTALSLIHEGSIVTMGGGMSVGLSTETNGRTKGLLRWKRMMPMCFWPAAMRLPRTVS